jgi:hypothetical protein
LLRGEILVDAKREIAASRAPGAETALSANRSELVDHG